jgi:hypothetical protein
MMRRFAAVVLVAGLVLPMVGCGSSLSLPQASEGSSGLILTDSGTETHYSLSVADGALMLTATNSEGTAVANLGLIDSVTGAHYSVTVTDGALTLVPSSITTPGALQIGLADAVTARNYTLAVDSGALILIPG